MIKIYHKNTCDVIVMLIITFEARMK